MSFPPKWVKKAVKSAGKGLGGVAKGTFKVAKGAVKVTRKGVGGAIKGVAKAGRTVGKGLGKVPLVGGGLKGAFNLTLNAPFQVADKIAKGERLDRVALNTLKQQVSAVKDVAPYAQAVLTFVPVVGPGINAGLGAGLALASGQPLTEALMAGVRGLIPGGAIAKSAFDVGKAAVEGKGLDSIALTALPVGPKEKAAIGAGLNAAARIAKGERVDSAILAQADKAMGLLPKNIRGSLQMGVAMAQGKNLQKIAMQHVAPSLLPKLKAGGVNLIKISPMLHSAGHILKDKAERDGYAVGIGLMQHPKPQPFHTMAVRATMKPAEKKGFDLAVATRVGMVKTKLKPPVAMKPEQQLGFYAMRGLSATNTAPELTKALTSHRAPTRAGAVVAVKQIENIKPRWYDRLKSWLLK
jgi:hypothetical protein